MRIASADGTLSEAITGLPEVNADGQGGLLGVTLDPSFSSNRMVYWTFSDKQPGGNLTAVGKGKLSEDEKTIENEKIIRSEERRVGKECVSTFRTRWAQNR